MIQRKPLLSRSPLKRSVGPKRSGSIKQKGRKSTLWDSFVAKRRNEDRDDEGLLYCADCRVGRPMMDYHHVLTKASRPDLYFDKNNLVWLCRDCHRARHA